MYCRTTAGIALVMTVASERISWTILTSVPAAIRIIFFYYGWLLFYDLFCKLSKSYKGCWAIINILPKDSSPFLPQFWHNCSSSLCIGIYSLTTWWETKFPKLLPAKEAKEVEFHLHNMMPFLWWEERKYGSIYKWHAFLLY